MESPQNRKNPTEAEKKLLSRRNFLKTSAGLALGVLAGQHLGEKVVDVIEKRNEVKELMERYGGRHEDFKATREVVILLLQKMKEEERKHGMKEGTLHVGILHDKRDDNFSEELQFLRDFMTKHLTSHASRKYSAGFKNGVLRGGYFAKSNLMLIQADIEKILEKQKRKEMGSGLY